MDPSIENTILRQSDQNKKIDFEPKHTYNLQLSDEIENTAWDNFLAGTAGGVHTQTSLWGQIKSSSSGYATRIIAETDSRIVGGVQMLVRQVPLFGAIGYVSNGPIFASKDPALLTLVFDKLYNVARNRKIQYLVVQPPRTDPDLHQIMATYKFQPGLNAVYPTATLRICLQNDLDQIMARMKKTTRKYIRRAQRKGFVGREGTEQDLPLFYQLFTVSSQRQGFSPFPQSQLTKMWRILRPNGYIKLFIVECAGEPVSAQIVLPFGDTVFTKTKGWSGHYSRLGPNYFMDWITIKWAHAHGYHYYDFEGIDADVAKAILNNTFDPDLVTHGPTKYKLNFGGRCMLLSDPYEYIYNPLMRWGYSKAARQIRRSQIVKKIIEHLRTA